MFIKLLLLFTLTPMIELYLLIKLGSYIGAIPTILMVALTGIVGVSLARSQGFIVVNKIKTNLSVGSLPADSLIDGLLILIGGVMLLTPGLITDLTGFSLIIPGSRKIYRRLIKNKFANYIKKANNHYTHDYYDNDDEW